MSPLRSLLFFLLLPMAGFAAPPEGTTLWSPDNLMAWCIVPFDAKKRGPEERAVMLEQLGLRRLAYDWRAEHIPTFDAEVEAMQRHGIEMTAWWFPTEMNHEAAAIIRTIEKYKITPQWWVMGGGAMLPPGRAHEAMVVAEAERIGRFAREAKRLGCKVALYNHGGWFGEPENQIAIIEKLRSRQLDNVGIVYNFHHGHDQLPRFGELVRKMKPYLLAVNLNGMVPDGDRTGRKILHLSQGSAELEMMRVLGASGWHGPVGIIDHREATDSEETLRDNLKGMAWLRAELATAGSGGARPFPELTNPGNARLAVGKKGMALDATGGGLLLPGGTAFRQRPLVIDCWIRLRSSSQYNILVASDPKASSQHWELYTDAGTGEFCVYQPGRGGNFRSGVTVCDDQWHHVVAVLGEQQVRLLVDGKSSGDLPAAAETGTPQAGGFAIGQLVEGGLGCDGLVDEVRVHRGTALDPAEASLGIWPLDSITSQAPPPEPAPFFPDALPLDPSAHPHHLEMINRDRVYDFYAKEALRFGPSRPQPELVPSYPGLDHGRFGHWGNQNEEVWQDSRWNDMDPGTMQSGILTLGTTLIPRAVCLRLGESRAMAACFDTDTLTWPGVWTGGKFLRFDAFRWGMLGGLTPDGTLSIRESAPPAAAGDHVYHGFYRHGARIIFSFRQNETEWLETAGVEDGQFVTRREKRGGALEDLTRGGPPQWPQPVESTLEAGGGSPWAIDTIRLPATPWNSLWHIGGHDFLPNGDAALCTFEGEVWVVRGWDDPGHRLRWKRFASGLAQPLGLKVMEGKIHVLGRDQVTRLHDLNEDGEADFYEAFSRAWETPVGGHDFLTGLESDPAGRLYFASGKLGISRLSADGSQREVLATGFRNPNGLAVGPNGEVVAAAQEGEWTAASLLAEIIPGGHYRHGGPHPGALGDLPPTLYFPRGVDNSCGGQIFVDSDQWGIPRGGLLHFSWGTGSTFLILREDAGGGKQGCAVPLPGEFRSGVHRGRFRPQDGQLYVTGMTGWGTYTPDDGCFQRMRYTGGAAVVPTAVHAHENGLRLVFAAPLDPMAVQGGLPFAQQWNYRIGPAYGSDEYSVRWPEARGHDVLQVKSVHLLEAGRTVFLEIPQLLPCHQLHLHGGVKTLLSQDLFLTLHQLAPAFTAFPGYQPVARIGTAPPSAGPALQVDPSPWEQGTPGRTLKIQTAPGLQFAQKELRARAGEAISLTLENPDLMPHNWTLTQPGMDAEIAGRADHMVSEPGAYRDSYVPRVPGVLCFTRLVEAGQSSTIHFTAPAGAGRYPYLCTFPGHTKIMRGVLIVE